MNKKIMITTSILMVLLSAVNPVLATEIPETTIAPPRCSGEILRTFQYKGQLVTEHKWHCVYNTDSYIVNVYTSNHRLLGWKIFKNNELFLMRDFTSEPIKNPLYSNEMNRYFDYKGYHVKERMWYAVYDSDFYTVKIFTEGNTLLGWQIFKNLQLDRHMYFV